MTKGEKMKKKLLGIAYELFLTKGYEETSVDDILSEAQIAKGTYYYYFESKEKMLEEVIQMMIDKEAENAEAIASSDMPVPMKVVGIISAFRPAENEQPIGELLERPENLLMHSKMQKKLMEKIIPLLTAIVEEGVKDGTFKANYIPVRLKVLLIVGSALFDDDNHTAAETEVFIDLIEKLLGAEEGTMEFIKSLIKDR